MFENLQERLGKTLKNISGRGRLTEENIKDTIREVRLAFLEAEVELSGVREFVKKVKEKIDPTEDRENIRGHMDSIDHNQVCCGLSGKFI